MYPGSRCAVGIFGGKMVPSLSVAIQGFSLFLSVAAPIGLMIYFKKRKNADFLPFFIGLAVFILFALVLEGILHSFVMASPLGETIMSTPILFALYGALAAAAFEETGRFVAMKFCLKKSHGNQANALMYGAGHGGFEMLYILGLGMLNNFLYSILINTGEIDMMLATLPPETAAEMKVQVVDVLVSASPSTFLLSPLERIVALILQISLSVLVWQAATNKNRGVFFAIAFVCHFAVDFIASLLNSFGLNLFILELIILVLTLPVALYATKVYRKAAEVK